MIDKVGKMIGEERAREGGCGGNSGGKGVEGSGGD